MRSIYFGFGIVALCVAALTALVGMVGDKFNSTFAEFLLVFVLAVEGLAAFFHVWQDRKESRAERLIKIQEEIGSVDRQKIVYSLYKSFPLTTGHFHEIGNDFLNWELKKNDSTGVEYEVRLPGSRSKQVRVDADEEDFKNMSQILEEYHRIGQLCEHEYISQGEFLNWAYLPVVRHWRRWKGFVYGERHRRNSPNLWQGFETLAKAAEGKVQKSR